MPDLSIGCIFVQKEKPMSGFHDFLFRKHLTQVRIKGIESNIFVPNGCAGRKVHAFRYLFYLLLAIPNILQADGRWEEVKKLEEKTENNKEEYEKRLDYQIAVNCLKYYRNEEDKGFAFFESVMEGNYETYFYNRQLIGLYKEVVAAMLLKQYEEKGDNEHYDEMKSICEQYMQTRIGDMWLKNMGIVLGDYPPSEYAERIPENHEEEEKHEDVIEAETEEHPSENIEDLVENTESGTSFVGEEEPKE